MFPSTKVPNPNLQVLLKESGTRCPPRLWFFIMYCLQYTIIPKASCVPEASHDQSQEVRWLQSPFSWVITAFPQGFFKVRAFLKNSPSFWRLPWYKDSAKLLQLPQFPSLKTEMEQHTIKTRRQAWQWWCMPSFPTEAGGSLWVQGLGYKVSSITPRDVTEKPLSYKTIFKKRKRDKKWFSNSQI